MRKTCAHPHCTNGFERHRWNAIRTHAAGWFEQKDGAVWCPDHTPEWVAEWRAKGGVS